MRASGLPLVLVLPLALEAAVLPPDRSIVWNPGVTCGIPQRTTICADVTAPPYNAPNDGSADASAAIQSAIDACPEGQVVFVPAGTYRLDGGLEIRKGITLRGEGTLSTTLQLQIDSDIYVGGAWTNGGAVTQVTGGHAKGSNTLLVADATSFDLDEYVFVDQLNDPSFVDKGDCTWNGRDGNDRALRQIVKVTGKSGNTLSIDPPLYYDFDAAFAPEIIELSFWVVEWAGLEDLKLDRIAAVPGQGWNVQMTSCANCWIRNVESEKVSGRHFWLNRCAHCEVRDSYVHHAFNYCSGGIAYGISVADGSSDTLIENNIAYYLNNPISNESLGAGNVVAYNFTDEAWNCDEPNTAWLMADMNLNHCAHNYMTLVEGNQSSQMSADAFHGSSSHVVLFRNHADAQHATPRPSHLISVDLHMVNRHVSAVGNVLGQPGLPGAYELNGVSCSNEPAAYKLGYNDDGDCDPAGNDPLVAATLLRHGNYDYFTDSTVWDPTIPDQNLPPSLYRASKPAFFGSKPWPLYGPDVAGHVAGTLPAYDRFLAPQNIVSYSPPGCAGLPSVSVQDVTVAEGNAGTTPASFAVSLSAASTQAVSVAYATADGSAVAGSDYTAVSGTLSFAPGTTTGTVAVPILGDTLIETDETLQLNLSNATNATLLDGQGQCTISDDDAPSLSSLELTHGAAHVQDLSSATGPAGGQDAYRMAQQPRSSYEVVVDAASGDVTPLALQRLAADNATVLQNGASGGPGSSVVLRWENASGAAVVNQSIRVQSGGCTTSCAAGDGYRIRAWDTTYGTPRFNNAGSQVTVLVLQNLETALVSGHAWFWSGAGALLADQAFALGPRQALVLNTATLPGLAEEGGSLTVSHNGGYGALGGKTVALEPATGFTFDTPMATRPR